MIAPVAGSGALGGPLVHLDSVGSTNDHARELALAGAPHGTTVVAESQEAGRGRHGRSWVAPRGQTLTVSFVLRVAEPGELHDLPLLAPLAVCDACEQLAAVDAQIKWPNDVWIERRKVAGILIEARPQECWAVVGIGLNVNTEAEQFPEELREIATSLRIASGEPTRVADALRELLTGLATRLDANAEANLADYRKRDALNGREISWAHGSGTARGVDEHGNLVVFTDAGERLTLDAGEVHLGHSPA